MNNPIAYSQDTVRKIMSKLAFALNKFTNGKVSPNSITIVGLLGHLIIAYLIINNNFVIAAIMLIVFGLFDSLDGALARIQKSSSKQGMLLDSITDRVKEIIIYASIAFALISNGNSYNAVWVVLACGASLLVSYINAWGEAINKTNSHAKNKQFRTGFMSYDIRVFTVILGLLTGYIEQAIIFITIFAFYTAGVRFFGVLKNL